MKISVADRLRRDALAGAAKTDGALRALPQVCFVRACLLAHFGHGMLVVASEDDSIDALGASPDARSSSRPSQVTERICPANAASCTAPAGGGWLASPLQATSSTWSAVDMEAALASSSAMMLSEGERGVCQTRDGRCAATSAIASPRPDSFCDARQA